MLISILNESTMATNAEVQLMVSALQVQFNLHAAPAWNQKPPIVQFYTDKTKVPNYAWVISILDNHDVANALGYHDVNADQVDGFVFCQPVLSNGGVVLYDATNPQNVSISSVLSHEALECFIDRGANGFADNGNISYAFEVCDPVQGNSYAIKVNGSNISMSDFIFPSWFFPGAKSPDNMPFNYMKTLKTPFTLDKGGYAIVRKAGVISQIFGEAIPDWVKKIKKGQFSRLTKRSGKKIGLLKRLFG